jgi:hypothetical protein
MRTSWVGEGSQGGRAVGNGEVVGLLSSASSHACEEGTSRKWVTLAVGRKVRRRRWRASGSYSPLLSTQYKIWSQLLTDAILEHKSLLHRHAVYAVSSSLRFHGLQHDFRKARSCTRLILFLGSPPHTNYNDLCPRRGSLTVSAQ